MRIGNNATKKSLVGPRNDAMLGGSAEPGNAYGVKDFFLI